MRTISRLVTTAGLVVLVPMASACTVTFGTNGDKGKEAPTATAPATQTPATQQPTTDSTPATTETQPTATPTATDTASTPTASGSGPRVRQTITVPPGHGISKLELIDIYGADTAGGSYGKGIAVFNAKIDEPLLINLRIQLFDAAGKEIASNEGLNPAYFVGEHPLVTTNLIELPKGARPNSFKVTLIDTTKMTEPLVDTFDRPQLSTRNGVPALTGSFRYTGKMKSLDAQGACIMPDGKIYEGQDGLTDNPTTASGNAQKGTYSIPLYDAKNADLSKATCYASV